MHTPAELNERLTSTRFGEFQEVKPPDPLYHYTTQAGLLSIIKTGELWATKVQYMNDSTKAHPAVPGRSICSMREPCAGEQRRAGGDMGWLGRDR
jgi:hypothetical protein